MIKIYDINDNMLIQAELISAAVREEELSKSDYIQLSFSTAEKLILPVGAYIKHTYKIDKVREVTEKFLLLEAYEPTQTSESSWKYTPNFQHPKMILSKTPFYILTRNSKNEKVKQSIWSFVGTISSLSDKIADFLNKDIKFGKCGWVCNMVGITANTVNVSFSDNDFISALSAICNAIGDNCEWHIDYDNEQIYIGKVVIGSEPILLEVGKNIGSPSINSSRESYYNSFSVFGGSRNITQVNEKGENISSGDIRLQLSAGTGSIIIDGKPQAFTIDEFSTIDLRKDKEKEPLFTKILDFSDIFPSLNTYAYNVRGRVKYVLDDKNNKIPLTYNSDGSVKEYKTFTVWYMRLAYPTTEKISGKTLINTTIDNGVTHYWYDFEITDDLLINDKNIGCSFEANFNDGALSTPLAGRGTNGDYVGFELVYHDKDEYLNATDDVKKWVKSFLGIDNRYVYESYDVAKEGFQVRKGDYEIIYQEDNDVIIPSNADSMLIPRGEDKPSLKCNITVLYNIAMKESVYENDAKSRLLEAAKKEIIRLLSDLNNYSFKSYPQIFAADNPCLQIGQNVTYNDGNGYTLESRVLKLTTNIDYDFLQEITIGNQTIKGTTTQLREDVQKIIASGSSNGGGTYTAAQMNNLIAKYGTNYFISKKYNDIAQGIITFMKGLVAKDRIDAAKGLLIGDGSHSISENGDAILGDVVVDRVHDAASTPADRVIIGAKGFDLYMGEDGKSHAYIDDLVVRQKFFASSAEIRKISYSGGTTVFSNAGSTLAKVSAVFDSHGDCVAYKCYACADDGTTKTMNWWHVGMMALCQTFNVKAGNSENLQNRYYWRLVVGVGQETLEDGKLYDYVVLSNKKTFLGSDSYVPTYTDKVIADENDNVLVFGDYGIEVTTDGGMGSMAGVFYEQEGKNTDDGGNLIANRVFYGYEDINGFEPDAPSAGDVIVQVGDQICWKSRGNVIKLSTSTEDNATDNAPSIAMYHNVGALYSTGEKDGNGKDIVSPYQWKTCTCVISPEMELHNAKNFKWFTESPDKTFDPVTVVYQIEADGMFRVGSDGKLIGENIYQNNQDTRYVAATCNQTMGTEKSVVKQCWWEVSYNALYITNQYEGSTSIVMSNGDIEKAPAYISLRCYTLAIAEDGTKSRGDVLLASVDVPVMRDGKKGDAGTTIKIIETTTTYAKTKDSTMPDKENDSLWSEKAPSIAQGEWLWTRTAVYYSDLSVLYSVSVSRVAKDGENGTSVKISSTSVTYATTSTYKQPTSFPYTSMPSAITLGWYLWTKTVVTYSDGQSTTTMSVSRIGDDGKRGNPGPNGKTTHFAYADSVSFKDGKATEVVGFSTTLKSSSEYIGTYDDETLEDSEDWSDYSWTKLKGEQGLPGTDGVGVKSADVMYCIGDSDSTAPTDNADWKTLFTELTLANGKYVWTCTKVIYTKGNPTYSGKQCLGKCEDFATVTEQYALSTSSTDAPTSGWGTTYSPEMGKWLWTRSEIVWTDGSKTYTEAVCVSYFGKDGMDGKNGDYTEYHFAISAYKATLSPLIYPTDISSWSATAIAPTTAKPYVWMRIAKFSNGSRVSTSYVRVSGEDGNDGKPGAYTVYDYKISAVNSSDSPTTEPEPSVSYPAEWQDAPMAVTEEYPYLWMRMTRKNDPDDSSVTYVCLTGEKGEQGRPGDKGDPGSNGENGQSALDIVIAPSTLVFDTDEDGLVPSSTSKSATISCYRQGVLVKDAIFTQYSVLGCSASISKNASGTCTVTISKIASQTIDSTTTVSVTSGYARVKILDELGVVSYAQVNFAVNVAKFTGQMVMNNKTFKTNFEEITNRFEDTDTAISDISGKYDNLPDDVKTSEAFKKYTSSIEQTARKISLSVSEKVVGLRNLLVGSDFKRLDDVNAIANGSNGMANCRLRTGDKLDGYNSCRIIDSTSTSTAYHGVRFSLVPVKGSTKYTLSTMAKRMSSSLGNGCLAMIHELANPNASDTVLSGSPSWNLLTASDALNTWMDKSFTFTTNSATRYLEVYFVLRTTGTFAICKPILEEGDTYNGYSKSENDYNYIGGNLIDNSRLLSVGGSLYSVGGTVMKTLNDEYAYTMASASGGTTSVFLIRKALSAYKDYVLSWYVQRTDGNTSGQVTVNFRKNIQYAELYTGLQSQYTQEGGTTDGNGNHSGYFGISNIPTGKMVRMWIHFRLYSSLTSSDTIYIQLYGNITAYVSRPKLEEGAFPTEWTDNPKTFVEEGSLSNKLYATGIDIESKKVTVTADNFKVRNNDGEDTLLLDKSGKLNSNLVEAKVLKTYNANGAHVEIEDGIMQVFGTNGIANIRFGVNADGLAVLSYFDNNGKWLYDLGPSQFDAANSQGASIESSLYLRSLDSDVLGTELFYSPTAFNLGDNRTSTLDVVKSAYDIKLFGSRMFVDDASEIKNNPHEGYQPFSSKKTGFTTIYRYTAAKEGQVYKPDAARGLTQALAEQADGKYFTSNTVLGANGALTNLANGVYFEKGVYVRNAPSPLVSSTSNVDYPAYVVSYVKFSNGKKQSYMVYSRINRSIGVGDLTIQTLDV